MVFLGIVLVVSIVAGALSMIAVSGLLLAILIGLTYRGRTVRRDPDQPEDLDHPD